MAFRTANIFFLPVHEVSFFLEVKLHCHWFDFFLPCKTSFKWVLHGNKVFWIILKCYNVLWHVPSTKTEHMNLLIAIAMLQMTPKLNSIIHHMFFYHIRFFYGPRIQVWLGWSLSFWSWRCQIYWKMIFLWTVVLAIFSCSQTVTGRVEVLLWLLANDDPQFLDVGSVQHGSLFQQRHLWESLLLKCKGHHSTFARFCCWEARL